jgi:hypothetical protein
MYLERDGKLEFADLPEVLALMRHHSKAGIAAILSEKRGLITDVDVETYLCRCQRQLVTAIEDYEEIDNQEETLAMKVAIQELFAKVLS